MGEVTPGEPIVLGDLLIKADGCKSWGRPISTLALLDLFLSFGFISCLSLFLNGGPHSHITDNYNANPTDDLIITW